MMHLKEGGNPTGYPPYIGSEVRNLTEKTSVESNVFFSLSNVKVSYLFYNSAF
jgi:hypothetical protein